MVNVRIYLAHDNSFSLQVLQERTSINLETAGVTRIVVSYISGQIDSLVNPEAFDYVTNGVDGVIKFDFADLDISAGKHMCSLIIYDSSHSDGQVWKNVFLLNVSAHIVT